MTDAVEALARIITILDSNRADAAQLRVKWPQLTLAMDEARTALARHAVEAHLASETQTEPKPEKEHDMPTKAAQAPATTAAQADGDEWKSWSTVVLKKRGNRTDVTIFGPTSSRKVAEAAVRAFGNGNDTAMVVQNERMPKLNQLRQIAEKATKKAR